MPSRRASASRSSATRRRGGAKGRTASARSAVRPDRRARSAAAADSRGPTGDRALVPNLRREHVDEIRRRLAARAGYDAAKTTDSNRRHWEAVDHLSSGARLTPEVRAEMRARCRHERDNNAYFDGIVATVANACVSTGPTLQMRTEDADANEAAERA